MAETPSVRSPLSELVGRLERQLAQAEERLECAHREAERLRDRCESLEKSLRRVRQRQRR